MEEITKDIIHYIVNPELVSPAFFSVWQILRLIFIAFSVFLMAMIVFLLNVSGYLEIRFWENLAELFKARPLRKIKVKINWKEVVRNAREGKEADRKLAIIEADDAVNDALGQLGYKESNLMEKLEGLNKNILSNIEDLKKAHKARRDIVYDPNRGLSTEEATELISIYEATFKELQLF